MADRIRTGFPGSMRSSSARVSWSCGLASLRHRANRWKRGSRHMIVPSHPCFRLPPFSWATAWGPPWRCGWPRAGHTLRWPVPGRGIHRRARLAGLRSDQRLLLRQALQWTGIRERKGNVCRCWAGDDDPHVPLLRSREIADHLNAPLEVVSGGGHLNGETGFNTFPQVRDAILAARGSFAERSTS